MPLMRLFYECPRYMLLTNMHGHLLLNGSACYVLTLLHIPPSPLSNARDGTSLFYSNRLTLLIRSADVLVRHTLTRVLLISLLCSWHCLTIVDLKIVFPSPGIPNVSSLVPVARSWLQRLVSHVPCLLACLHPVVPVTLLVLVLSTVPNSLVIPLVTRWLSSALSRPRLTRTTPEGSGLALRSLTVAPRPGERKLHIGCGLRFSMLDLELESVQKTGCHWTRSCGT